MKEKGTRAHSIALTDKRIKHPAGTSKGRTCCLTKGVISQHVDFQGNCRAGERKQVSNCVQSYHLAFLDSHLEKDLETIHLVWADKQFVPRRKEELLGNIVSTIYWDKEILKLLTPFLRRLLLYT